MIRIGVDVGAWGPGVVRLKQKPARRACASRKLGGGERRQGKQQRKDEALSNHHSCFPACAG